MLDPATRIAYSRRIRARLRRDPVQHGVTWPAVFESEQAGHVLFGFVAVMWPNQYSFPFEWRSNWEQALGEKNGLPS